MITDHHRTRIEESRYNFALNYQYKYWCIGSCFAYHLDHFLSDYKFDTCVHPFGIVYNPLAIARQIHEIVDSKEYTSDHVVVNGDVWSSAMHHSEYNQLKKDVLLNRINSELKQQHAEIRKVQCVTITLGTAYVFEEKRTGLIVANCHKRPADLFELRMCKVDEIVKKMTIALEALLEVNPTINIIFSVSPIRHIKNGLIGDQKSKSTLLLAAHEICEHIENAVYFPAYEIMMNDLRDYRYYERDMIHPSELAIEYILNYFQIQFVDVASQALIANISKLKKAIAHRPFNPNSNDHLKFKVKLLEDINDLVSKHPFLNFDAERIQLKAAK